MRTEEVAPAPPAEEGKKPAEGEAAPEAPGVVMIVMTIRVIVVLMIV